MTNEENNNHKRYRDEIAANVAVDNGAAFAVLATDISYIKRDISDIKSAIHDMGAIYVTQTQYQEVTNSLQDHEQRLRYNERNITRIITFGTALILFIGIIEFIINKFF